jgi:hypothetical protein
MGEVLVPLFAVIRLVQGAKASSGAHSASYSFGVAALCAGAKWSYRETDRNCIFTVQGQLYYRFHLSFNII